jgi:carbamoyltransferase
MEKIFGISAAHDSSFCVLNNGKIEYFNKEERLSKNKRDRDPIYSIFDYDSESKDIHLAFSSPTTNTESAYFFSSIAKKKHNIVSSVDYSDSHHLVHANLAFYNSGFDKALVFVIDRDGSIYFDSCRESETVFIASYPNNFTPIYKNFWLSNIYSHDYLDFFKKNNPDCEINGKSSFSIVKVYESATSLILQNMLENGKVMGLSAYGDKEVEYPSLFKDDLTPDDYYFGHSNVLGIPSSINRELHKYATDTVTKENYKLYADYAWQVQKQTQEAVLKLIQKYTEKTGIKNVCITGGYGLNVVANHYYTTQLEDINFFFEPIADDSGNSIGSAMKLYRDTTLDKSIYKLEHTFFNGKKYNLDSIVGDDVSVKDVAKIISEGKSVAVYNGLAEAGPRALGNRSILFDPRDKEAKEKVNKIKKREWYRPFAGMVIEKDAKIFFNMGNIEKSEFMTISFPVTEKSIELIPGVIHVDNTCRIQTISSNNPVMFDLLNEFKNITGIGVLLNTSFNLAGKPLVEKPQDAIETLLNSELDYVWFPEISKIVSKDMLQN